MDIKELINKLIQYEMEYIGVDVVIDNNDLDLYDADNNLVESIEVL